MFRSIAFCCCRFGLAFLAGSIAALAIWLSGFPPSMPTHVPIEITSYCVGLSVSSLVVIRGSPKTDRTGILIAMFIGAGLGYLFGANVTADAETRLSRIQELDIFFFHPAWVVLVSSFTGTAYRFARSVLSRA